MDYTLCIICQKIKSEPLRCPALDLNTSQKEESYRLFLAEWQLFRDANIFVDISLPTTEATTASLLLNEAKWHTNCRRNVRQDRLERKHKSNSNEGSGAAISVSISNTDTTCTANTQSFQRAGIRKRKFLDICLFCQCPASDDDVLHAFQKVELTEELRKIAVDIKEYEVLAQVAVGDLVANELKYHTYCYVNFKRRGEQCMQADVDDQENPREIKILEEILGMIEEDLAAGRRYFALKTLYEQMNCRAEAYNVPPMNRTRLKDAILQRFSPILKEEEGFRNEKILVCSEAMKDVVQHSLVSTVPSEDYRVLCKAALICRRQMQKERIYDFHKDGFHSECQKNSVCDRLKYLIGMLLYGPSHGNDVESEQATLTIAQLIAFNADTHTKNETPLPVYVGLLVHSKFRSSFLVNELSRLGISINYDRVQYMEKQIGHTVLQHFYDVGVVCPTEMRNGLFTVGAVDNIDHNVSARNSKDSFHGTAISLFQTRKHTSDGTKREMHRHLGVPGKLQLPDEFTALPHLLPGWRAGKPSISSETLLDMDYELLSNELRVEQQWSQDVMRQLEENQNSQDMLSDAKAAWSAYHARNDTKAVPCISGLFPLFTDSSVDPRMILHAMELVKKSTNHLNPTQIPVITGDQPIYAIMKALQWSHNSVKDMIVMLGGFHTEKHGLNAIGDILQGSGWTQTLTEAGICNAGTADGILNAVHVTKARYAHQVTYVALNTLLHEAYKEAAPAVDLTEWMKTQSKYPTFAYWILVMTLESVLFTFVRAHRQGNFDLYVQSLQRLGELFFACDHYHYARWVPVHVEDMKRLPLSIISEFRNGRFTVQRSQKRFSSIAIDQSHEQMNKTLKGSGGVIGLTQDAVSMTKWSVCGPEVCKHLEDFKIASNADADDDCDFFHHDERVKRQEDFLGDVSNVTDVMRDHGNPFIEQGEELVGLHGQITEDKHSLYLLEERGKHQYADYIQEILIDKTKPFDTSIKKNSFRLFKAPRRKLQQPEKLRVLKSNASVLGQMYIATQARNGDIKEFFAHESQKFPPSLAQNEEKMYHSRKSDILDCLQKEVDESLSSIGFQLSPTHFDAVVIDGGALIHSLIPRNDAVTFHNYLTKQFMKNIEMELRKTQRLDIVWDAYWESSIKGETRDNRGLGVRLKIGPNVRLPKNWTEFLRQPTNKVELFNYLSQATTSNLQLFQYDFYITYGKTVLHVGPGAEMTEECDHEEADTRIVVHVLHALHARAKTVLVQTVDSDVVVILINHFERFESTLQGCEVFVSFGHGKHNRIINIREVSTVLGVQRCTALPLWVSLTGCDSTSSLRGRSKRTAFNTWKKSEDAVTQAMVHLMQHPFTTLRVDSGQFKVLEAFFVAMYGGAVESINEQRREIFCKRNQNPEVMPPTQNALFHHCQRALYQASVWASAHLNEINAPDPLQFGWRQLEKRLLPLWMSIPDVSAACQELIKCGCQKACGNACTCKKHSLNCTALCKCKCMH